MLLRFRRDPTKQLKKQYEDLLSEAMQAQRAGDIRTYSELSQQADEVYQRLLAEKPDQDA